MDDKIKLIKVRIRESINAKIDFVDQADNIFKASEAIVNSLRNGGKILICGNGGSAADAQHIAAELIGKYLIESKAFPAIAMTTDSSILTSLSNDYDYETIFSKQVEGLAKKGDILMGISTSGNSKNIIKAFEKGKEIGVINISLTGRDGGKIRILSDININSYSNDTPRIQECHQIAYHTICELAEKELNEYFG